MSYQNILPAPSKLRLCRNNGSRSAFRYLCSTTDVETIEWRPKSIGGSLLLEAAPPIAFSNIGKFRTCRRLQSVRERATTATPGRKTAPVKILGPEFGRPKPRMQRPRDLDKH
eukprot:524489-Pleurochrysis_carterae.AAC.1